MFIDCLYTTYLLTLEHLKPLTWTGSIYGLFPLIFNRPGVAGAVQQTPPSLIKKKYRYIFFFLEVVELVGGGSVINGAYPD